MRRLWLGSRRSEAPFKIERCFRGPRNKFLSPFNELQKGVETFFSAFFKSIKLCMITIAHILCVKICKRPREKLCIEFWSLKGITKSTWPLFSLARWMLVCLCLLTVFVTVKKPLKFHLCCYLFYWLLLKTTKHHKKLWSST